jgi:hypothetical protein
MSTKNSEQIEKQLTIEDPSAESEPDMEMDMQQT